MTTQSPLLRLCAAAALGLSASSVGAAQPPYERQQLADLAYVLGEAQALAAVCDGGADVRWRTRMDRLLELEGQQLAFRHRLADAFNAGFVSGQAAFRNCDANARKARRTGAAKGAALARALAESTP